MLGLFQRERKLFYAFTPDVYSSSESLPAFGAPTSPVFSYCRETFVHSTVAQKKVVFRMAGAKLSVYAVVSSAGGVGLKAR